MRVLGIDFGTSNTVAMLRTADGVVRPLLFDGSPLLPSAVYFAADGRMAVGRDAERNARVDPGRFEPNPKRRIDDGSILLGDRELPVARVIATVLGRVATEARRHLGGQPDEVRITHPARWADRRRGVLLEAARLAGLPVPRLVPEPVAAASYFTAVLGTAVPVGRSVAVYDLGGGTFDATVVCRRGAGFEVLSENGLPDVGGLDFDDAVIGHLGATYSRSHARAWAHLTDPLDGTHRRHRRMLWEDVRGAKEMLSRASSVNIHLPALEVDAHLTREEFERLIRPHLDRTVACLTATLRDARLAPADLVGIFLVGGSSRVPLAAHLIHSELGVAPTALEQPETVVAEGCLSTEAVAVAGPETPRPVGPERSPWVAVPVPAGPAGPGGAPAHGPVPPGGPPGPGGAPAHGPVPPGGPPGPAVHPGGRPVAFGAPPVSGPPPVGAWQGPVRPHPRPAAGAGRPGRPLRRWYEEPAVVAALAVAGLLVFGFLLLLVVAVAAG